MIAIDGGCYLDRFQKSWRGIDFEDGQVMRGVGALYDSWILLPLTPSLPHHHHCVLHTPKVDWVIARVRGLADQRSPSHGKHVMLGTAYIEFNLGLSVKQFFLNGHRMKRWGPLDSECALKF